MTEPTAEQVADQDRERAHALIYDGAFMTECAKFMSGVRGSGWLEDAIATALARVRIEATEESAHRAVERAHDLGIPAEKQESIAKAIRASRGKS